MQSKPQQLDPKPLLGGELSPLTGAYAFFDAAIGRVAEVLSAWRRGLDQRPVEVSVAGSLHEVGRDDNGRMVFTATGRPQPYEEIRSYSARRVVDRLTPKIVDSYCRALGLRPFDEGFFRSEGLLITTRDARPDLSFSIAAEQARYGFKPPVE
jgi:hypothetical protein